MLYHFTDLYAARSILLDGEIYITPHTNDLPPLVMLTNNPNPEGMVVERMWPDGWMSPEGCLVRFSFADSPTEYLDVLEFSVFNGIEPELFDELVQAAHEYGSDFRDWRISKNCLLASSGVAVEVYQGRDEDGKPIYSELDSTAVRAPNTSEPIRREFE
jgi:hypothetical protein